MGSGLILAALLAAYEVPPEHAFGGNVRDYQRHVFGLGYKQVRITLPECYSACTLYLWAGRVCVAPKTRLLFHRPVGPDAAQVRRAMITNFNNSWPGLGDWFRDNAGTDFVSLTGIELNRMFGVPVCREE